MVLPAHIPHLSLTEGVARLPLTARDILTRPTPSAPKRALVPGEHSPINNPSTLARVLYRRWLRGPHTARVQRGPSIRSLTFH